jgi:transcriptional regulator with XRE-family HTH domain
MDFSAMKMEEKVLKEIGEQLKKLRMEKGYKSYESFAIDNDLSRMQYWRIEKGLTNITLKSLLRLLKIHGITIQDFFKRL